MDEETDPPINQSSDNIGASERIMSDINTPPLEKEGLSASDDDTDQEKTKDCTTLPSCFTMEERSAQIQSLAGTSSKVHNECKYFCFYYLITSVFALETSHK
jgi:alpha-D-ribose 1-methylphosphonate 5-triphosphate synthase subunit PhnI